MPIWYNGVVLILANIDYVDLVKYIRSAGLRVDVYERFNIVDVVHYLRFDRKFRPREGSVVYPVVDKQKVRDFLAYNSVRIRNSQDYRVYWSRRPATWRNGRGRSRLPWG